MRTIHVPAGPLVGHTAVRVMLSTITVHSHKPADSVLQSVPNVLYPSFDGSPPRPERIKYHQKKRCLPVGRVVSLHRRRARASEVQKR